MDEGYEILIFNENSKSFKKEICDLLKKKNDLSFKPIECYLMDKNFKNILLKYNNDNNKNNIYSKIKNYFIDNINSVIKMHQEGSHLHFIRKDIMLSLINKPQLEAHNISLIYVGNKKIIIDFQNNDNKSLLIMYKDANNLNENKLLIITCKNNPKDKIDKYKALLLEENIDFEFEIKNIKEKYSCLKEIEDYLKINDDNEKNINKEKQNDDINNEEKIKEVLKILIMLNTYEKYFSEKKCIPNENQYDYYLINSDWINKYKEYYYSKILFEDIQNNDINFTIIDSYMNNLINILYEKNKSLCFQPPDNLRNLEEITPTSIDVSDLKYYNNCYILPGKIMEEIIKKQLNINNKEIKKIDLLCNGKYILLNFNLKIINIGEMNENLLFQIKYVILFNSYSNEFFNFKEKYFSKNNIKQYIRENNCNEQSKEIQIMKNKNKEIGKLLILNDSEEDFGSIINDNSKIVENKYINNKDNYNISFEDQKEKISKLEEKIISMKEDIKNYQTKIEEKEKKEKELNEKISSLMKNETEYLKKLENYERKEISYKATIEENKIKYNEEINKLKKIIDDKDEEIKEEKSLFLSKEEEINLKQKELNNKTLKIQKKEEEYEKKVCNLKLKSNQIDEEKKKLEETKKNLEKKLLENNKLVLKNNDLDKQIKEKEKILNDLNSKINELNNKIGDDTIIGYLNDKKNNNDNSYNIKNEEYISNNDFENYYGFNMNNNTYNMNKNITNNMINNMFNDSNNNKNNYLNNNMNNNMNNNINNNMNNNINNNMNNNINNNINNNMNFNMFSDINNNITNNMTNNMFNNRDILFIILLIIILPII